MKTDKIREKYIQFFKEKGHKIFASDSLVPDDPSLLFTSAGMNQFKPYFLGDNKGIKQAVSCQKCLRTGDIDRVGETAYHHTFFEMLGNFSFGGYFKKEAIEFAWEFLTSALGIKPGRLWVSVYSGDQDAYRIWKDGIGIPAAKIVKLGQGENFWPANVLTRGPDGPCGPCSEIFFDRGKETGCGEKSCNPACSCGRFVEIWNLVFTQFDRQPDGELKPLPRKNIDTGMGLERMASVLQQKESNFEIDILAPAVAKIKDILSQGSYPPGGSLSSLNAIADYSRAVTFVVADGVYPSNEERGYVIRKIIRRALIKSRKLNNNRPFLYKMPAVFAGLMGGIYPEIEEKKESIAKIIKAEEEKYFAMLAEGKIQVNCAIDKLSQTGKRAISSHELFRLYDTYGLPLEIIRDFAGGKECGVDEEGFNRLLKEQQARSRKKSKFDTNIFKESGPDFEEKSEFLGYCDLEAKVKILKLFAGGRQKQSIKQGEQALIVLDKTPFYAEAGGQLDDRGQIITEEGRFRVERVFKAKDTIVHQGKASEGKINKGSAAACVDRQRRDALARAHTATHLLQAALRETLGSHVSQQGSLVGEDRLRFDFTHFRPLSFDEVSQVEKRINRYILKACKVCKKELSRAEAKKEGALAFFKEKYKDKVRVVSIADYSKELCGGTHLDNTSQIGGFAVVSQSSVKSGTRRIEAVVGEEFYRLYRRNKNSLGELAGMLKCGRENIRAALGNILADLRNNKSLINKIEKEKVSAISRKLSDKFFEKVQGVNFLAYDFSKKNKEFSLSYSNFFSLVDSIKEKIDSFFVFFAGRQGQKMRFLCFSSLDLKNKGISCKKFISEFRDELHLKGGGTDKTAQGVITKDRDNLEAEVKKCFVRLVENESS